MTIVLIGYVNQPRYIHPRNSHTQCIAPHLTSDPSNSPNESKQAPPRTACCLHTPAGIERIGSSKAQRFSTMSKPLALLLLAALALLLLAAERGAAFRAGAPASSRRRQRPQRQQQRPVRQSSFLLGPLRSTTEDKAEPAAPPAADASAAAAPTPASIEAEAPAGPCKNFPKCDGSMRSKGCDGMGKIQGGIATVPFLGWWPIKVRAHRVWCGVGLGSRMGDRSDNECRSAFGNLGR